MPLRQDINTARFIRFRGHSHLGQLAYPPVLEVNDIEDLDSIHRVKVWADHHFWIEEPIHSYDVLTNAIISTILDKEVNIRSSFQSHCMAFGILSTVRDQSYSRIGAINNAH